MISPLVSRRTNATEDSGTRAPGNHWNGTNWQYKALLEMGGIRKTFVMNMNILQYTSKKEMDKTPGAVRTTGSNGSPTRRSEHGPCRLCNKEDEKETHCLGCT